MNKDYKPTDEEIRLVEEHVEVMLQEEHHKDNRKRIWGLRG